MRQAHAYCNLRGPARRNLRARLRHNLSASAERNPPAHAQRSHTAMPDRARRQADEQGVAEFLRDNPGWLAEQPGLYAAMDPPRRVHGDTLADHMAARIARAQADTAALASHRRAADSFTARIHAAALALIANGPAALPELAVHLGLDSARLCAEYAHPGATLIRPGTVHAVLGRRETVVGEAQLDPALHGEAASLARWQALVRLPGGTALLALACRDGRALAGASAGSLRFLAQVVAATA